MAYPSSTITSANQQIYCSANNNQYTVMQPSQSQTSSQQQLKALTTSPNHWTPPPPAGKKVLQLCSPEMFSNSTSYTSLPTVPLQKKRKNRMGDDQPSPSTTSKSFSHMVVKESMTCICERPATMIICRRCGSELFGHVQRVCHEHPKRINLMDHKECSFCRSIYLSEISSSLAVNLRS